MKKTKEQKGITLIALIITIVVLMILAAVAINSITNDGIISKAESVKNTYTEAQNEEQKLLDYYELVISQKAWTQNGTTVSRNGQTLNVGDTIEIVTATNPTTGEVTESIPYEANNVNEWRVLGAEYGKLLLVSASSVGDLRLEGKEGYNTGIAQLTDICDDYLNTTYADEARSIKVEDLNRVTGFKPESYPGYGKTYTYTSNFEHPTKGTASASNPITETNTSYGYSTSTSAIGETAYNVLFNDSYWLASSCVWAGSAEAYFGLHCVDYDVNDFREIMDISVGHSWGGDADYEVGVRAVVSLNSDVQVVKA